MKDAGPTALFQEPDKLAEMCTGLEKDPGPGTLEIMTEFDLTRDHPWAPFAVSPVNTYFASLNALARWIKPRRILEVGAAFGMSAASLIKACPHLELFVSLDLGVYGKQLGLGRSNIDFAREKIHSWCQKKRVDTDRVKFFAVNTQPPGSSDNDDVPAGVPHYLENRELLPLLEPESFDLIFVDGKHTGDGLYNDLSSFWPLVKPGGLMLCDDLHDGRLYKGIHSWAGGHGVLPGSLLPRKSGRNSRPAHLVPPPFPSGRARRRQTVRPDC